ncbi:DUF2076 domain-containing protein [Erwinia sp. V71]|uniref:DUF2076 domain-containing protein n=1 Tax=Erwinia sp. V71 TaxID=3369424 RepID=UPI003F604E63
MQNEEQRLIENLFSRLKQAESQSGPRDAGAEQLIARQLQQQPGAPYYMAQALLIQEAALKKLNERVSELENRLAQQQQSAQQSSGGFLSGLFGGGNRQPQQQQPVQPAWNSAPVQQQQAAWGAAPGAARGTGFLGGALQTAVGVAGGVVMANMLTSMFHHSQPEEIVNIINEPALPDVPDMPDTSLDTFNNVGQGNFLDQDAGLPQDFASNDYSDFNGFGSSDFDDDDSFV